ncbi:MAG TPA: coenzyme F420-0:L-glutamate ligase [Gammaproteobacteria bacterium]|nr:coenzyme F420-0:L-glutamate ligase [Gammaproteobacteria bacterium]|tara:strand:- start:2815 stop:3594 length:780 start_codon:yes stop_codon:yes gene_type:complete
MKLSFSGVDGIPMVQPGDDLVTLIHDGLTSMDEEFKDNDVVVIAQKIVSKAEDRYVDLTTVSPGAEAQRIALEVDKDPRKVQAILDESNEVVRSRPGVLIVEHRLGFVQANAGIDQSNITNDDGEDDDLCLLLPLDADASARKIRDDIRQRFGVEVGVIVNDSVGRAWRMGTLGLAIGVAGFTALEDYIGQSDIYGKELAVTQVAAADEMAAGASLVMGQTTEKTPVVLVRGYQPSEPSEASQSGVGPLLRPKEMDLFR